MRQAPKFWWKPWIGPSAALLWPPALVYGALARHRMTREPDATCKVPVICIGNFIAGGAGKTPSAITLAKLLWHEGHRPFILTRGYGGTEAGPLLVEPDTHSAAEVGDEALLLAEAAPTVVSIDRVAGANLAAEQGATVILMDDGFQNPSLAKDLSIVVVDGATGIGNGMVIPAGPLRAPLRTQMVKADALLVIGDGKPGEALVRRAARRAMPILRGDLKPRPNPELEGRRVLAFAGIGRPEKFYQSLRDFGAEVVVTRSYPDHYPFTVDDAKDILTLAEKKDLLPVTTAKDMLRLQGEQGELLHWLAGSAQVLSVDLVLREETRAVTLMQSAIHRHAFRQPG